ncbi:MAG: hypothetical protein ACI83P_002190 [Janthinobacterium sp.]
MLYGAGPRTVPESNAKKAHEKLALGDLRRATKVVALTVLDLLVAWRPCADIVRQRLASALSHLMWRKGSA